MAAQLLKRATQLAAERDLTPPAVLAHLLNLVVRGRNGVVPPGLIGPGAQKNNRNSAK